MTPEAEFRVRPGGREPVVTAQASGDVPPVAVKAAVYDAPATPSGRVVVLIERGAVMVIERFAVAMAAGDSSSVTATVNEAVPSVDGVPVIAPVAGLRINPVGKEPLETDHEYGCVP
jgi:hypothetical protein